VESEGQIRNNSTNGSVPDHQRRATVLTLSGVEQRMFMSTLDCVVTAKSKKDMDKVLEFYKMLTGRPWQDDYYNWYVKQVSSHDAGSQGQSKGKEDSQ
jgi:hypothetical protein